jgi:hypothetical protein
MSKNHEYLAAMWKGVYDVFRGRKPLAIIESLKDVDAYEIAVLYAEVNKLAHKCVTLIGEDGFTPGEAVLIAQNPKYIEDALWLIASRKRNPDFFDRDFTATRLGFLLGYPAQSIREFLLSPEYENCQCDCCGGPSDAAKERRVRRTMYHA